MSAPAIISSGTAAGGPPVGGTGTPNTIPRWTGASTLGDSIVIQGSTANAIGIGNAPTTDLAGYKALEVGGLGSGFVNADNDLWITANAKHSGGGWKYAVAASTPSNSIRANAGAIIFNRAGNGTAGNALTWLESARIDSSGNVGIGTAGPATLLNIRGASPTFAIDDTATGTSAISFRPNAASYAERAAWTVLYGTAESRISAGAAGGSYFQTFYTNGSERARIDSAGNFGLGVTPSAWSAYKAIQVGGSAALWSVASGGNDAWLTSNGYWDGTNFRYITSSPVVGYSLGSAGHRWVYAASGTAGNTFTFTTGMTMDTSGNIYGTSGTTGMTNGFFYIPAAAGAPTGVPTAVAGRVPMYYDTTNNQFYVYNGAWKKVTLA